MAEGERPQNDSWESWIGGWVQTAKEKSSSALEMVKKDLAEFTCTIQKDTERAVEITKESLNKENTTHATNRVKAGLTSFLDNISRVLVIPPDDDYVPVKVASDGSGLYDRGKARLHAIQLDASTYMDPPDGSPEQYSMWLESFNMDEHKGEISELLVSKVEVRALYTKLVPSEVSHAEFWQRYIYRVHQLHCDEARKQALMKRADQAKGDSFSWDDDDDWSGGEDDEDNHSDWEKMPRPSQLQAAEVPPVPSQQSEKQHGDSSIKSDGERTVVDVNKDTPAFTATVEVDSSETEMKEQIKENTIEKALETGVSSVFAESSEHSQDEKAEPENNIPTGFSSKSEALQDIQDDSEDLHSHSGLQMPSADLWSLHIPNDSASASHLDQDTDYIEAVVQETDFPIDVHPQVNKLNDTLIGFESCAAVEDVSFATCDKSGVAIADGASGAAETDVDPTILNQVLQIPPDASAASLFLSDSPQLVQISDKDMSFRDTSAEQEVSNTSEQPSEITPVHESKAENQQESPPVPVNPAVSVEEVVPDADNVTLICDVAADTSVPTEAADVTSDHVNIPQQTLVTSTQESDAVPEDLQVSPQTETLTPVKLSDASDGKEIKEMGMRLKGDMVVVGDRDSPLSSESTDTKEIGLEEDWEQDFDIEVTEDDLKTAENIAKQLGENLNAGDDDWENWE